MAPSNLQNASKRTDSAAQLAELLKIKNSWISATTFALFILSLNNEKHFKHSVVGIQFHLFTIYLRQLINFVACLLFICFAYKNGCCVPCACMCFLLCYLQVIKLYTSAHCQLLRFNSVPKRQLASKILRINISSNHFK